MSVFENVPNRNLENTHLWWPVQVTAAASSPRRLGPSETWREASLSSGRAIPQAAASAWPACPRGPHAQAPGPSSNAGGGAEDPLTWTVFLHRSHRAGRRCSSQGLWIQRHLL